MDKLARSALLTIGVSKVGECFLTSPSPRYPRAAPKNRG